MKLSSKEIAELTEGKLIGDPGVIITGAAGLLEASVNDVSFLANKKYVKYLDQTKAGLIFVQEAFLKADKNCVSVKNPQLAFAKVLVELSKEKNPTYYKGIHPSANVAKTAVIGKNVSIGPFVVIEDNVQIGDNTTLVSQVYVGHNTKIGLNTLIYPNVSIRENIVVGSNVIIHSGSTIGSDGFGFIPTGKGIFKIPQIGNVVIEDDVEIGANVSVDRATTGTTRIGQGTKIDNQIQIAHNVEIGNNCMIVSSVCIAGSTKIGNNVTIAGQTAVVGHINIGDNVIIGGKSGVTADIKAGDVVSGFPCRPHREELKIQAMIHKLPEFYDRLKELESKGK